MERNPDIIIVCYMIKEHNLTAQFRNRVGWAEIEAVKNGKIYADIDPDILLRPGPRIVLGLKELAKRFYPEKFETTN